MDIQKKLGYELNHIYREVLEQDVIQIGQNQTIADLILTLYERSIALSGDLKRIPVLRSIVIQFNLASNIFNRMVAAGITTFKSHLTIYNSNDIDEDDIIFEGEIVCFVNATTAFGLIQNNTWEYKGGLLLNSKLRLRVVSDSNVVCAGAALTEGTIDCIANMEVDWVPLSNKEVDEYIKEFIFATD